ncbi:MAG: nuclease-related domain-containing protein [Methylophilus sp.]|uniref:nuclease-related domain-containing protein n=1 Tax=Methylophilus sp. TaxID=29541 RepID=UPI003F9FCF1D
MNQNLIADVLFKSIYIYIQQFWWLLALIGISFFIKTAFFKGLMGEQVVRYISRTRLEKENYLAVHNVTLETGEGTTQIDHIYISQYGLFVVETKNFSGWIFGSERSATWTQQIYKNRYKFQNPLRQNYKHLKAIESALDIDINNIHSVIVFLGGATFKTPMPDNVRYASDYADYIKSFTDEFFTHNQVIEIHKQLLTKRLRPSYSTHKRHVNNLKNRT